MQARRLLPWILVLAWAAVIFAFSSVPSLGTGLGFWDLLLRKLAHAGEFGLLALLFWRALRRDLSGAILVAGVLAIGYAASDEYHQTFVSGRVGSLSDWAIDSAGVVIALVGLRLWLDRRERRRVVNSRAHLDEIPESTP